jgi:phage shock protein E
MFRRFFANLRGKLSLPEALKESDLLVVDVRSVEEVKQLGDAYPKSVNIPVDALHNNMKLLGEDKTRPILFYCAKGIRAGNAAKFVSQFGYKNVYSTDNSQSLKSIVEQNR